MKKLILLSFIALTVYSCKSKTNAVTETTVTDSSGASPAPAAVTSSELDGLWTGAFSSSPADEALRKKAEDFENANFKKLHGFTQEESEGETYITDLKLIPAELRKAYYMEPLDGYYSFKSLNKVSIIIDGVNGSGELIGRSICAGNERPVKGSFSKTGDGFKAELKEPGDSLDDGIFTLNFYPALKKATGNWTAKTGNTKGFALERTDFKYDPVAGNFEGFRQTNANGWLEFKKNPSVDLLTTKDVENLTRPELAILRNLVFARHGYSFQNAAYRNFFERYDWYMPYKKDIRNDLTDTEKKNTDKLKSFEKYASAAYDEFGR